MPDEQTTRSDSVLQATGWAEPRLMPLYNALDDLYREWRDPDGGTDDLSDLLKRARNLCEEADVMIERIRKGGVS